MYPKEVVLSLNIPVVDLLREISRVRGSISKFPDETMKNNLKNHMKNIDKLYEELKISAEEQGLSFEKY